MSDDSINVMIKMQWWFLFFFFRQPKPNTEKNDQKHETGKIFFQFSNFITYKLLLFAI